MPTIRSLKTRLLLSNSFSFTVFHSNWQYFTHSNSQQLTVIHCDEPNTGFEPRLISAYFLPAGLVGGYGLSANIEAIS